MRTKLYTIAVFTLITLTACDDYLNREPITSWSDSNFFTQESHIRGTLYGGYDMVQAALGSNFIMYGDMRGDIYKLNDPTRIAVEKALNNSLDINLSGASWRPFYNIIKQANLVISNTPALVESKKISSTNGNDYMGQAYCMRAFAYFWIVRIWGDAPIVNKPYTGGERIMEVRKPQQEIFDSIHVDLGKALKLIASANVERVRFTRTAANAIQAQVYAWQNNWPAVITSANRILNSTTSSPIVNANYSLVQLHDSVAARSLTGDYLSTIMLNTGYSKMFNAGLSSESIFELPFSIDDNENNNTLYSYLGDNYAQVKPRLEFIDEYEIKDWRQFIHFWGGEKAMKFFNGSFARNIDIRNIILLRLAETVLLKAEALVHLNDTEADSLKRQANIRSAMELVNLIRFRAGGKELVIPESTYSTYSPDQIKDIVLQERKLELAFEGYRYFDLIRTGNVARFMQPINGQTNPLSFVWPIHLDEIRNSNGLIVQNEYYK